MEDNLNTHKPASLYEAFPAAEARRLVKRFEWHCTPKHGSWLNMAEAELSVLSGQCLDRRIPDKLNLIEEVARLGAHTQPQACQSRLAIHHRRRPRQAEAVVPRACGGHCGQSPSGRVTVTHHRSALRGGGLQGANGMILNIVVPCYNEEEVLPETARRLSYLLDRMTSEGLVSATSGIFFIDDGSIDRTWAIIRELREARPDRFHGIKLSRNQGHQNALLAGLRSAPGDAVVSIDADLQDDVEVIPAMVLQFLAGVRHSLWSACGSGQRHCL